MGLIDKLKVAGMIGISTVLFGCQELERGMDEFSRLSIGPIANANAQIAETSQQSAAWSAIGQIGDNAFYRDTQIEAAEAGRSQVNVNVEGQQKTDDYIVIGDKIIYGIKQPDGTTFYPVPRDPETQRIIQERLKNLGITKSEEERNEIKLPSTYMKDHPRLGKIVISSCNYILDVNKNGTYNYPEEFIGLKNKFSKNERITVDMCFVNPNKESITFKLLNRNGKVIESGKTNGDDLGYGIRRDYNHKDSNSGIYLFPSNYEVFWYCGDEFLGKLEFEVYDEK